MEYEKVENKKTELRIYTECFKTLDGLKGVIEDIRKIEKEYNCNCTLIDVKIADKRLLENRNSLR